jgi:hypothetical protein
MYEFTKKQTVSPDPSLHPAVGLSVPNSTVGEGNVFEEVATRTLGWLLLYISVIYVTYMCMYVLLSSVALRKLQAQGRDREMQKCSRGCRGQIAPSSNYISRLIASVRGLFHCTYKRKWQSVFRSWIKNRLKPRKIIIFMRYMYNFKISLAWNISKKVISLELAEFIRLKKNSFQFLEKNY